MQNASHNHIVKWVINISLNNFFLINIRMNFFPVPFFLWIMLSGNIFIGTYSNLLCIMYHLLIWIQYIPIPIFWPVSLYYNILTNIIIRFRSSTPLALTFSFLSLHDYLQKMVISFISECDLLPFTIASFKKFQVVTRESSILLTKLVAMTMYASYRIRSSHRNDNFVLGTSL